MRVPPSVVLLVLALAVATPAAAPTTSLFEERIARLVGTPTPAGPLLLASDRWTWEIEMDGSTVVWMEAHAPPNSPFYLTTTCSSTTVALPSTSDGRLCPELPPGATNFTVSVDPAGGVAVDILLRVRGHVSDVRGDASPFTIRRTAADAGCVVPGVCLP